METIALFGGSFDPPHIGHKAIVEALEKLEYIDKIVIMPTYLNPFKSDFHASAEQRFQWLQTIFEDFENIFIDDFEVQQKRQVATVESVRYLLKKYSKIYVVIGADNLSSLHKWKSYNELKSLVTFIVVSRDKIEIDKEFLSLEVNEPISSSTLREKMQTAKLPQKCAIEIEKFYKEKNEK